MFLFFLIPFKSIKIYPLRESFLLLFFNFLFEVTHNLFIDSLSFFPLLNLFVQDFSISLIVYIFNPLIKYFIIKSKDKNIIYINIIEL